MGTKMVPSILDRFIEKFNIVGKIIYRKINYCTVRKILSNGSVFLFIQIRENKKKY